MKIVKSIKPLSFLWIGSLLGSGSTFLIYMILARELGPEKYGSFSSAMAITLIFSLLAGFGIPQLWLKLFGEEGINGLRWLGPSLRYVLITLFSIIIVTLIIILLQPNEKSFNRLLFLLIGHVSGYVYIQLVGAKLQLEERFTRLSFWQISPNMVRLLIVLFIVYPLNYTLTLNEVGIVYLLVGVGYTFFGVWIMNSFKHGKVRLVGHNNSNVIVQDKPKIQDVLREAWPFGLAGLFAFIYMQSDIIMLKYLYSEEEAGYYNVAFNIMSASLSFPIILFGKFLIPKYHRWSSQNISKLYEVYKKGNVIMIVSGVVMSAIIFCTSQVLVPFLFGREYQPSVSMINLLSISIPFVFLAYSLGATLLTGDHMKVKVQIMGSIATGNIILNFLLIKPFGAIGAITSTILSNLLLVVFYRYFSTTKVFKNLRK